MNTRTCIHSLHCIHSHFTQWTEFQSRKKTEVTAMEQIKNIKWKKCKMSKSRHKNQKLVANEAVKTTCTFSILIWLVGNGCACIDGIVYTIHATWLFAIHALSLYLLPFSILPFTLHSSLPFCRSLFISISHTLSLSLSLLCLFFSWPLGVGVNVYGASRRQRQLKNEGHLLLSTDCYLVNVCMRSSAIFRYNCV